MSDPLLLIGCGGHARSLIDVVETSDRWHVHGLVGLPDQVGEEVFGHSVIGCDQELPLLRNQCDYALLASGHQASWPRPYRKPVSRPSDFIIEWLRSCNNF